MGHLLATVNPEAAERIEDASAGAPDVGTVVVYIARSGMQRMGRREFPAFVLGHDEEGFLDLFVLMEPEDMIMESHVRPRASDQQEQGHCWRHVELDEPADAAELRQAVEEQGETIAALRSEISDIKRLLLGDYKPADLSVYDLLAEFEGKLHGAKAA